ncbi:MAG: CARDB domain-containing protein, partial [Dehalococcoidales bacterium]|nr:CARDB domain-containing protein [Dehalococcoidales bacterium]
VPAAFTISNLSITPAEVNVGENVTISVLVANTGDLSGSYEVTLEIDNVVVETKDVNIDSGASQKVTFTIDKNELGTYSVNVSGLSGSFTVQEEIEIPAADTEVVNWWLWIIVGLVGAAVVVGVGWIIMRRQRV